jgi:hypothetical protein
MGETESNKVEWAAQCKRDAFWNPIYTALETVFAALMFLLYCIMWVAMAGFGLGLVYLLIGGLLNIFGVYVPGISIR